MTGWSVDQLREYAERVSQEDGMATVLVAVDGDVHEFIATSARLGHYQDVVTGALVESLRARQAQLDGRPVLRVVPGPVDAAGYPPGEGEWWPGCTDK